MTQNSKQYTPGGQYYKGDKGVKVEEKRQKKIVRKNALYSDEAIAKAKAMRGA